MTNSECRESETQLVPKDLVRRRYERVHRKATDTGPAYRRGPQLDFERILNASSLLRLSGVTQIISPGNDYTVPEMEPYSQTNNRLTHSFKVAHVARAIATTLISKACTTSPGGQDDSKRIKECILRYGGIDADVVTAAGLAHDLGHPPYGHAAEEALDKLAREELSLPDGFEGNAQTMRIITKIEPTARNWPGMDLTYATIAAITKYPWVRKESSADPDDKEWRKFNAYRTEHDTMLEARSFLSACQGGGYPPKQQTLEASIMDLADDMTYAFHDLEDFYLAGLISADRVAELLAQQSPFLGTLEERLKKTHGHYPFTGDGLLVAAQHASHLFPFAVDPQRPGVLPGAEATGLFRHLCRAALSDLIQSVDFRPDGDPYWLGGPYLNLEVDKWNQVQILKAITKSEVIDDTMVIEGGSEGAERVVFIARRLFEQAKVRNGSLPRRLLLMLEDRRDDGSNVLSRKVLDYICTLTDYQAKKYSEAFGFRTRANA